MIGSLKNMAYLKKVVEKEKVSLENTQAESLNFEAKDKGVHMEESDVPNCSVAEDWQRRPSFLQHVPEAFPFEIREQRRPWTNGNYDSFLHDERQDQRIPTDFNMQKFQQPAQNHGRRYYQDDQGARGE